MTDTDPGGRGFDLGSDADELFGGGADEPPEGANRNGTGDREGPDAAAGGISDRTATDVFGQLQADVGGSDADDVLADESPDDIIASADEPDPERADAASELVDEDALEELLLTGRTKDQEFLWVDADDEASAAEAAQASATRDEVSEPPTGGGEADEPSATGDQDDEPSSGADPDDADSSADPAPDDAEETALALRDDETDLATTDTDSSGVLGWVRSMIGRLF